MLSLVRKADYQQVPGDQAPSALPVLMVRRVDLAQAVMSAMWV